MSGRVAIGKLSPVEGLQFADCERIVSSVAPEPPKRKRRDVWVPIKKQAPYAAVISFIVVFLIFISTTPVPVSVEKDSVGEDYYIDKDGHVIQKTEKDTRPSPAPSLGYASPRAPAGWSDDLNISNNASQDIDVAIAVNGNTLHVVYSNSYACQEIMYVRSLDAGSTWSEPKRISNGACQLDPPSIGVYENNVHIVWSDTAKTPAVEIFYIKSSDAGDTWAPEQIISDNDGLDSQWPALAVNGSNVHVTWGDYRDSDWEVYYVRSIDSGANWGSNTRLTNSVGLAEVPSIDVNGSNIHLSFEDERVVGGTGTLEIWYMNSTDNGDTWSQERMLTNTPSSWSASSDIAVDGENIHIAYFNGTNTLRNIFYLNSTNGGITWDGPMQLTAHASDIVAGDPSISVNGQNVSVVWADDRAGDGEIYFKNSTDGGATFSGDLMLTDDDGISISPDIAITDWYNHVVFYSTRSVDREIFYKRSPADDPVPIPEFEMVLIPMVTIIALFMVYRRRCRKYQAK